MLVAVGDSVNHHVWAKHAAIECGDVIHAGVAAFVGGNIWRGESNLIGCGAIITTHIIGIFLMRRTLRVRLVFRYSRQTAQSHRRARG